LKATEQDPTGNSLSVPVVLEPYDGNVQRPVRNTLKEVYTAIENDLLFCKASITNTAKSRATVACTFLVS
jgi:hypothetical protein